MKLEPIFRRVAGEYGLDWQLLSEIAWRESRWDPQAVGAAGERGLMQIMPATWQEWAPRVNASDPFDPLDCVRVSAAYLLWVAKQLRQVGRPEPHWTLVAYNWGIGNVLQLLRIGGGWSSTPEICQDYASGIVLATEADLRMPYLVPPTTEQRRQP